MSLVVRLMIGLLIFILLFIGFMEMLCVGNMASGPFTSGYTAYKKTFSFQFERAHALKIKKLKERLDNNLNWMSYHEMVLHRLNVNEIIFRERQHQFLAHGGPQIIYSHLLLEPNNDSFTITGRLSKTYTLSMPIIGYTLASKADGALVSLAVFIATLMFFAIMTKMALAIYYVPRYQEMANAVMDVLEEPNKSFKHAPYWTRDLTNHSAP